LCTYDKYTPEKFENLIWALANLSGCEDLRGEFDLPVEIPVGGGRPFFCLQGDLNGRGLDDTISVKFYIPLQVVSETLITKLGMPTSLGSRRFFINEDHEPKSVLAISGSEKKEAVKIFVKDQVGDDKVRVLVQWFLANKADIHLALRSFQNPKLASVPTKYSKLGKVVI